MPLPPGLPRFPVICGPTAGGKTSLALALADELAARGLGRAQVVSADAFLVYRGLDLGTAKPTLDERRGVPHHLIDVVEPTERYSVHDWLKAAQETIAHILRDGGTPIVVGGTHLYIQALMFGLFEGPEPDPEIRQALAAMPQDQRRRELEHTDPDAAARIHPADERRTIRALEVHRQTGRTISSLQTQWERDNPPPADRVLVGLEWETEALNRRINARVRNMIAGGLVDEARALWESGRLGPQAGEALGYKQLVAHFEGHSSLEDAIERIKIETRRFAKNQRTWLRRLRATPGSVWIDASRGDPPTWARGVVEACVRPD
ncbi:MAG: tRNA (adenosine(37)-N6)-dimethylallyltransferase MiaA [Phycisphaerales bacterium]